MTFTLKQTLNSANNVGWGVTHDDSNNIYFIGYDAVADYHVFDYDITLDSITQISNNASFTGKITPVPGTEQIGGQLVYFSDDLYLATYLAAGPTYFRIYKYDGSGTSWTLVDSVTGQATQENLSLGKVGSQIVFVTGIGNTDGTITYYVRYSGDGSSWSDGTVDTTPSPPVTTGYNVFNLFILNTNTTAGLGMWLQDRSQRGVSSPTHYRDRVLKWDGISQFVTQDWYINDAFVFSGNEWVRNDTDFTDILGWYTDSGTRKYEQGGYTGSNTAVNDNNVQHAKTMGFESGTTRVGAGRSLSGGNAYFHLMVTPGTWTSQELIAAGSHELRHVVRFTSSGKVFIFTTESSSTNKIYERDTVLDPAASGSISGKLWVYKTENGGDSWSSKGVHT